MTKKKVSTEAPTPALRKGAVIGSASRDELIGLWRKIANEIFCERLYKLKQDHPITEDESFEIMIRIIEHYR